MTKSEQKLPESGEDCLAEWHLFDLLFLLKMPMTGTGEQSPNETHYMNHFHSAMKSHLVGIALLGPADTYLESGRLILEL